MATDERTPIRRSLLAAQKAYANQDVSASKRAHGECAKEEHNTAGEFVKASVFGGLDGILTSFAVVAGASGGGLTSNVVLIIGFSNLFAGALSMGTGEYLSKKAEVEYASVERQRESWEMQSNPEGEIAEMVDLYTSRGMSREDATTVITTMAKYEQLFVDMMMSEELGLQVSNPDATSIWSSLVMFTSFVVFGSVPLLSFACLPSKLAGYEMLSAIGVTAIGLTVLGSLKSKFSLRSWWICALETCVLGCLCALVAYFVGNFVDSMQK